MHGQNAGGAEKKAYALDKSAWAFEPSHRRNFPRF